MRFLGAFSGDAAVAVVATATATARRQVMRIAFSV